MKNKYSYILLLLLATVGLTVSCSEFVISEYNKEDSAIYFIREQHGQGDSISNSFALSPDEVTSTTVYLDIRTMGYLSDEDRPFVIKQINSDDEDAAVPGVHYVPFDDPQVKDYFVIPANSNKARVPIILLRDQDPNMLSKRFKLELVVEENEYFRPGIDKWRGILVTTTSELVEPTNWVDSWSGFFGPWGAVKMKFISDVTGFIDWDNPPSLIPYIQFLQSKARTALIEYNDAHPGEPLMEADGFTKVVI